MIEYNFTKIGERIKNLRKSKHLTQDELCEQLCINRNTLSAVERGSEKQCRLDILLKCCSIFDCDMGYLLGEFDECKKLDTQFIHSQTGLTETSISNLALQMAHSEGTNRLALLNWLLDDPRFIGLLDRMIQYCGRTYDYETGKKRFESEKYTFSRLHKGDIERELQLRISGEITPTITEKELTTLSELKDVSYLKVQRALDNILDCLEYNYCNKCGNHSGEK